MEASIGIASIAASSGRKQVVAVEQGMVMAATVFDHIRRGAAVTQNAQTLLHLKFVFCTQEYNIDYKEV
eukprot:6465778-Amphidinium_carterae.2